MILRIYVELFICDNININSLGKLIISTILYIYTVTILSQPITTGFWNKIPILKGDITVSNDDMFIESITTAQ